MESLNFKKAPQSIFGLKNKVMSSLVLIQKELLADVLQKIFFNILQSHVYLKYCNFIRLHHNCFSVNFAQVLRTHFSFFTEQHRRTDSLTVFLLFVCTVFISLFTYYYLFTTEKACGLYTFHYILNAPAVYMLF